MTNPEPPAPPRKLSAEIDLLLEALAERPLRLREMITVMQGRAYTLLLILISIPFCLPIPLPGLSTVLGGIIALIGLRLSLRQDPWLPERVLDAQLSAATVTRLLTASRRVARLLESVLRPRFSFLVDFVVMHHVYGAMICISGLLLLLPLPLPFTNMLPALTVILLSGALLERDGYFAVGGMLMFVITIAFFASLFAGGMALVHVIEDWVGRGFTPVEAPPEGLLPEGLLPDDPDLTREDITHAEPAGEDATGAESADEEPAGEAPVREDVPHSDNP
ncbi:MAG: exopolysaccharide biosynthesis protein [Chthoniobacteraceae bacterium]